MSIGEFIASGSLNITLSIQNTAGDQQVPNCDPGRISS